MLLQAEGGGCSGNPGGSNAMPVLLTRLLSEGGGCSGNPGGSSVMPLLLPAKGAGCSGNTGGSNVTPLLLATERGGSGGGNPGGASRTGLSLDLAVGVGCGIRPWETLRDGPLKPVGGLCLAVLPAW